jgi:hypothetical protein
MDPSQSETLMKSLISIEQDSLRCDTFVLIDSAATLSLLSQISLNQNGLVGIFEVQKSLFIMLMDNEIQNAFFYQQFLQQYLRLAKGHFLVSDSMFRCISNASNSYFGLPTMKHANVFIRSSDNFVLISNQPFSL